MITLAEIEKRKEELANEWMEKYSNPAEFEESGQHEAYSYGFSQAIALMLDREIAVESLLMAHVKRLHGTAALLCDHDYEPNTCMTEMRCEKCGVDMNLGQLLRKFK